MVLLRYDSTILKNAGGICNLQKFLSFVILRFKNVLVKFWIAHASLWKYFALLNMYGLFKDFYHILALPWLRICTGNLCSEWWWCILIRLHFSEGRQNPSIYLVKVEAFSQKWGRLEKFSKIVIKNNVCEVPCLIQEFSEFRARIDDFLNLIHGLKKESFTLPNPSFSKNIFFENYLEFRHTQASFWSISKIAALVNFQILKTWPGNLIPSFPHVGLLLHIYHPFCDVMLLGYTLSD